MDDRLDRIDSNLTKLIALYQQDQTPYQRKQTGQLFSDVFKERIKSLERQLRLEYRTLNRLEERRAEQGPTASIEVLNSIEATKETITKIEADIGYFKKL